MQQKSSLSNRLTARAKLWLELDGRYVFGRGISEILKAIQQTGSIKAAARELDKSYRYVWAKLKRELTAADDRPAVPGP